jgi:hypothetical protein
MTNKEAQVLKVNEEVNGIGEQILNVFPSRALIDYVTQPIGQNLHRDFQIPRSVGFGGNLKYYMEHDSRTFRETYILKDHSWKITVWDFDAEITAKSESSGKISIKGKGKPDFLHSVFGGSDILPALSDEQLNRVSDWLHKLHMEWQNLNGRRDWGAFQIFWIDKSPEPLRQLVLSLS